MPILKPEDTPLAQLQDLREKVKVRRLSTLGKLPPAYRTPSGSSVRKLAADRAKKTKSDRKADALLKEAHASRQTDGFSERRSSLQAMDLHGLEDATLEATIDHQHTTSVWEQARTDASAGVINTSGVSLGTSWIDKQHVSELEEAHASKKPGLLRAKSFHQVFIAQLNFALTL
jgi:hypothetical protein